VLLLVAVVAAAAAAAAAALDLAAVQAALLVDGALDEAWFCFCFGVVWGWRLGGE
jgi:hypothetical protein